MGAGQPQQGHTVGVLVAPTTHVLLGPLIAVVVLGGLVLLTRWVFGTRGVRRVVPRPDYGLLVPVARASDAAAAEAIRARLAEHGIRGTIAPAGKGYDPQGRPWPPDAAHVLVFADDAPRAEAVVHGR